MSHGGDELPEEHEEHVNHEAWVIPYADLLTLLMAMFIALFAMSTVDLSKFKAFAIGFNEALGGGKLDAGVGGTANATSTNVGQGSGNGALTGGATLMPNPAANSSSLKDILSMIAGNKAAAARQQETLADVQKQITDAANKLGIGDELRTKQLNNGLQVTLLTDQVLFESGRAELQPGGIELLHVIGNVLKSVDNSIRINGYTDNVPIGPGGQFPSNTHLSSFRAVAVFDYFVSIGLDPERLYATGRGALDPVASNDTAAGRAQNRRVEIVVESKLVKQTLDEAGLNAKPVTPTTTPITPLGGSDGATPNLKPNLAGH